MSKMKTLRLTDEENELLVRRASETHQTETDVLKNALYEKPVSYDKAICQTMLRINTLLSVVEGKSGTDTSEIRKEMMNLCSLLNF